MRSSTLFLGALASSHASETSCFGDESSLLQARVRQSTKGAATKLLESSEDLARSLKTGEIPEAVNNAADAIRSALEQIGPMLQEEHSNAQSQIDRQLDEIQACHTSSAHGSTVMGNLAGELTTMTQCMADEASANEAQELHCSEWSNHAHQLSFPSCSPPSSAGLEGIYSTAQNMQNWIEDQWENIHSKYTACAQATTHATDETARCAPVIAEYDDRFCQHEIACSLRTACHDHELSVYNVLVSTSEEGMVARQEHYHTIEQVDCILHLISAAVEAQESIDDSSLENCRAAAVVDEQADHVQEHLTLSFPTPEAWSGCGAPQPTDPQCAEVELPQAWFGGQASSSTHELMPSQQVTLPLQDRLVSRQFADPTTPGPWTLIIQYGVEGTYIPTGDAVGVPSLNEAGFAKLSDVEINALPSGGAGPYNYYWLSSDGESPNILIRVPSTEPYDDTASAPFSPRGTHACKDTSNEAAFSGSDQCPGWDGAWGHDGRFQATFDSDSGCGWWLQGVAGTQCYVHLQISSQDFRCYSSLCQEAARRNVKIYKFTGQ